MLRYLVALGPSLQTQGLYRFQTFPPSYHQTPQFIIGTFTFLLGMAINIQSDRILCNLRRRQALSRHRGEKEDKEIKSARYAIPTGGLFRYVSCANYTGEIMEWGGYAIACQASMASLSFFISTCSNLIPRAFATHRWYTTNFDDYPAKRKDLIPFVL